MTDTNHLKQSIIEQAQQEGRLRLEAAKMQLDKEFETSKAQLLREKEAERQSQLKDITQKFQVEAQQIRNQERQSTLVSKQTVLKELFAAALENMQTWSARQELDFITKVLNKYVGQIISVSLGQVTAEKLSADDLAHLRADFPTVTFEAQPIANEAGLVVSVDKIDDTYLYVDLMDSIYREESSRIAAAIFTEN